MKALMREFPAFIFVGVLATACNYAGALGAERLSHAGPMSAGLAGYVTAVAISYFGNSLLTFRRPALHGPQFARFMTISLAGLALNLGLVFVDTRLLGWELWRAEIPVVLIVPVATFLMSKFWAFRTPAVEPAG